MKTKSVIIPLLAVLFGSLSAANAVVRTWDGSSSGLWTTAANWSGSVTPVNGDSLVFPPGPTRLSATNSAGGPTTLTAITFTGSSYVVQSSSLSITNGLTNATPINSITTLNAPLVPRASQTWESAGKTTLVLNSNITYSALTLTLDNSGVVEVNGNFAGGASGDLTKLGGGRLEMNGAGNTLDQVRVTDGTLEISGTLTANSLIISNGATLAGSGTGTVFTCAGEIRPGDVGGTGLGVLTFNGASPSVFQAGGRFQVTLHSPAPGTGHDQLKVAAVPNLANGSLSVFRDSGFSLVLGQKFVIVTNTAAGALTTTFTNLPQNARITNNLAPVTIFEISYTGGNGNDVELTVVDVGVAPTGVTRVWDAGAGNNRGWTNAANWDNNTPPNRGDDLVFPAAVAANSRTITNNFEAADAAFNRLWFGGQGASWILRGGALKLLGGLIATNELPLGEVQLRCANVELLGSQMWSATNLFLDIGAPMSFGGHTLRMASAQGGSASFERVMSGPGTLLVQEGSVSLPSNLTGLGMSNVAVRIEGGTVGANDVQASGPQWQLINGTLLFTFPTIPGLLATGGRIESFGIGGAIIVGDLTLAPACTVSVVLDSPSDRPFTVTGQVNLNNALLNAGPNDFSLFGIPLTLISNAGPNAVNGTFAGLPEGALVSFTNEFSALAFQSVISYVGGDGNDVTLTPVPPTSTGITRAWTGAGADSFWATAANWSNNTPPALGDDAHFPVSAAQRDNTNATLAVTLNSISWAGSNYLHTGGFALVNGLRHGATGGTNAIAAQGGLGVFAPQTWAVSNAAATLQVFGEINNASEAITAQAAGGIGVIGLGPITKTGAGVLELENCSMTVAGGLIADGGTVRLTSVSFDKTSPLFLHQGRVEVLSVNADNVTATNGELVLRFAVGDQEFQGGLSSGSITLNSNVTLIVDWTNGAPTALDAQALNLNGAQLNLLLPPGQTNGETILVASYRTNQLNGIFANLPEGAVTNFGGRDLQIHYAVSLPLADPHTRTITLTVVSAPPLFTRVERLGSGEVMLRGIASAGAIVFIEGTQNFSNWTDLGSTTVNGLGSFTFLDSAGLPFRFYKARSR